MELLSEWAVAAASMLTIGYILDQSVDENTRRSIGAKLDALYQQTAMEWVRGVAGVFIALFDVAYVRVGALAHRTIWKAILFSYLILFLARLTMALLSLPTPNTEFLLLVAIGTSTGTVLLMGGLFEESGVVEMYRGTVTTTSPWLRDGRLVSGVVGGMIGFSVFSIMTVALASAIGISVRTYVAIGFGASLILPTILTVCLVPLEMLRVSPVRAFVSSTIFMGVIAYFASGAREAYMELLLGGGWVALSYVAFNLFADTVSLAETRWILERSTSGGWMRLCILFLGDLLLSASIYLVLPLIVGQSPVALIQALLFRGETPWMGILFWTTFSTSATFYLFFATALLLRLAHPLAPWVHVCHRRVGLETHPIRGAFILMTGAMTVVFGGVALIGLGS